MTKKIKELVTKEPKQISLSPESLISQAISQNVPVDVMERLLAMRTQLRAEKAKEEFVKSMAQFQQDCPIIEKTKKVFEKGSTTKVRYKYASLESIVEQVKKPLADNGLSYSFDEEKDDKFTNIICIVTHELGHSQKTGFKIPIGTEQYMSDVQKYGARMTFGKRYAFCNAFGIMTGDEDTDAVDTEETQEKPVNTRPSKFTEMMGKLEKIKVEQLDLFLEKIKASSSYTDEQKNEFTVKVMEIKQRQ